MQIKNLQIILFIITFFVVVMSFPIAKDKKVKSLKKSKDINIIDIEKRNDIVNNYEKSDNDDNNSDSDIDDLEVFSSDGESTVVVDDEYENLIIEVNDDSDNETTEGTETTEAVVDISDFEIPTENKWTYTPEELVELTDKVIAYIKKIDKKIYDVPDEECSFETVIAPYGKLSNQVELIKGNIDFYQNVSTDKKLRDVSEDCIGKLDELDIKRSKDKKMFKKVTKVIENIKNGKFKAPEDPLDQRFLEYVDNLFRDNGLALSDEKLAEMEKLQLKLSNISSEYRRCLNEEETILKFTKKELEGVPEDFYEDKEPTTEDGKEIYVITLDTPNYYSMIKNVKDENVRKLIMRAYNQRCKPNIELMKEAVEIRLKIANLFGYKTHSEYVLKSQMAEKPENVMNFLVNLQKKLIPIAEKEKEKLLEIKKEEMEKLNKPFDNVLHSWDDSYYNKILLENEYSLNDEEIKKYFPTNEVTKEMLNIYEEIFSLKCVEIENPVVWHPDVRQFNVFDKKTDEFIGSFYLDLYPRDGKYDDFACFNLGSGYVKDDGSIVYPVGAMVTNFPKPTSSKPSLLTFDDVVTYFHELGHIFHQLCSRSKWINFNGWYVESDFSEAPSQMLENWVYEPEIIERLSHNYLNTSEKMPKDLIDSIVKTKNIGAGLSNLTQIFYGLIDMKIHSIEKIDKEYDINKIYNDLEREITLLDTDEESWAIANFDHLLDGYDATYYGYLYSQVFSVDMYYTMFKKYGILNPEIGEKYRKIVLGQGATKDAMEILKEFLGREPNDEAFIKSLGI